MTPSPKVTDQENKCVGNYFDVSSQDQYIENTSKRILTHVLRRWDDIESTAHPSTSANTPGETIALRYIQLKSNILPDSLFHLGLIIRHLFASECL